MIGIDLVNYFDIEKYFNGFYRNFAHPRQTKQLRPSQQSTACNVNKVAPVRESELELNT